MFFKKARSKTASLIPCSEGAGCTYEYGMSDRDIEGMPFPKSKTDKRKCPKYGHICPVFMEEFGLSADDLNIRSTIHCGFLATQMIESGQWNLAEMEEAQAEQIRGLLKRYNDRLEEYPPEEFPKMYDF